MKLRKRLNTLYSVQCTVYSVQCTFRGIDELFNMFWNFRLIKRSSRFWLLHGEKSSVTLKKDNLLHLLWCYICDLWFTSWTTHQVSCCCVQKSLTVMLNDFNVKLNFTDFVIIMHVFILQPWHLLYIEIFSSHQLKL